MGSDEQQGPLDRETIETVIRAIDNQRVFGQFSVSEKIDHSLTRYDIVHAVIYIFKEDLITEYLEVLSLNPIIQGPIEHLIHSEKGAEDQRESPGIVFSLAKSPSYSEDGLVHGSLYCYSKAGRNPIVSFSFVREQGTLGYCRFKPI